MTEKVTTVSSLFESPFLRGLGWWNVFFACEFALAACDYLSLSVLYNALLFFVLLLPVANRKISIARHVLAAAGAAVLVYSESWLPGLDSITSNAANIAGFSASYIKELLWDFVNFEMVGWGIVIALAYLVLRNWIRLSVVTVLYFVGFVLTPYLWNAVNPPETETPELAATDTTAAESKKTAAGAADSATITKWLAAFHEYEKDRKAQLPEGLSAKDTPFDIVIMNICSLSNDDLAVSDLTNHSVFSRFNLIFDRFNSATSYSGPATLRLLNMACGQPSHDDLYVSRPECQIMNRLDKLGFKQHLYLDHSGDYDDYLETLRNKAGLTAPLESDKRYPIRYMGFDDEPLADDLAVLRDWNRRTAREKGRSVTLMNFMALHDGNRLPRHAHWENFKPRAKIFLDQLQAFMRDIERSGRKVMLIVVPEHGAAVRGDRVQTARLRDIPSMRITQVPTMVKFFGLKELNSKTVHVTGDTSYLALGALIGKVLETNFYSSPKGTVDLTELAAELPQTNPVSENAQSVVLTYKGRDYLKRGDNWVVYPK